MKSILLTMLLLLSTATHAEDPKPPFGAYVAMGQVSGWTIFRRFGMNPDVDTATVPEDIWDTGGAYPWPTSAQPTTIVSDDANDTSAGTGCRTVRLTYTGEDYVETTQDLSLTGTTPATFATDVYRLNSADCITSGSGEENAGTLQIKHGATVIGQISPGEGGTLKGGIFTVPAGKSLLLDTISISALRSNAGAAEVDGQIKLFSTKTWRTLLALGAVTTGTSQSKYDVPSGRYVRIPEKTDVRLRIVAASANNMFISSNVAGYLVDETLPQF